MRRAEGDIGADNEADERKRENDQGEQREREGESGGLTARGETSCRRGENVTKRGMAKPRGRETRGERERSSSDGDLATAFMAFVAIGWEARGEERRGEAGRGEEEKRGDATRRGVADETEPRRRAAPTRRLRQAASGMRIPKTRPGPRTECQPEDRVSRKIGKAPRIPDAVLLYICTSRNSCINITSRTRDKSAAYDRSRESCASLAMCQGQ